MATADPAATQLGKYRIVAKLGQGGMASVWLGLVSGPANFTKLLVIKELRADVADDPEFLVMFQDEARLAARLNHPNVVHTYEVGEEHGRHFIAMEYLEGQPLHLMLARVRREQMPLAIHVRILSDTLAGLHYAHTLTDFDGSPLSIVHRDVSPQNVFVSYDGHVRVVDFGIAKAEGGMAVTQEGMYKGKVAYMAPEQALSQKVDGRADVFSVGVMLWEALAKRRMVQGMPEAAALHARVLGTEAPIRELAPDAPEPLVAICERALAVAPEERFASAEDMKLALDVWLAGCGEKSSARDVSALLTSSFQAEREAIAARIEQQIKLVRGAAADEAVPLLELGTTLSSITPTPRALPTSLTADTEQTAIAGAATAPPRETKRAKPLLVALAVAALLAAGFVVVSRTRVPTGSDGNMRQQASAPAEAMVTLSLTYGPALATARLDGTLLGPSPLTIVLPRDVKEHSIVVSLPEGAPLEQKVVFDRDLTLSLVAADPRSGAASAAAPSSAPTGSATAAPRLPPPGARTPADAGNGSKTKTQRPIDTDNPYTK